MDEYLPEPKSLGERVKAELDLSNYVSVPVDLSNLSELVKDDVVKKTEYNAKIENIEDKIPGISNSATDTT